MTLCCTLRLLGQWRDGNRQDGQKLQRTEKVDSLITAEVLRSARRLAATPKAVESLAAEIRAYQHRDVSRDARLIWLVDAWISGIGGRESADLLEGDMWELIPELGKSLAAIGATRSLEYLKKLIEVLGGNLPSHEEERARLIESKYGDLRCLDKAYRIIATEESAQALMRYFEEPGSRPKDEPNR